MACSFPSFSIDAFTWANALIVLFLLARIIQYMVATLVNHERQRRVAMAQIVRVAETLLLSFLIAVSLSILSSIGEALGYGTYEELINNPPTLLVSISQSLKDMGDRLVEFYVALNYTSSVRMESTFNIPRVRTSFSNALTFPNVGLFSPYVESAILYVYGLLSSITIAQHVICYVAFVSLFYLIPIGLILRSTGLLARPGSTMVALGVAVGVFLPYFSHIAAEVLSSIYTPPSFYVPNLLTTANYLSALISSSFFISFIISLITSFTDLLETLIPFWGVLYDAALKVGDVASLMFLTITLGIVKSVDNVVGNALDTLPELFSPLISVSIVAALYLFTIAFAVIGVTRALSIYLGGEYFLYRVTNYV